MKPDLIYAHTSFIGHTGYANHSREFFTALNKNIPVRVRNFAHIDDVSYLTKEQNDMVIRQTWDIPPFKVGTPFDKSKYRNILNIILNETNHYYFYDEYDGPKIAYNVWESTRQPEEYFNRILQYDQLWVPTEWQKMVSIEQGYPAEKIKVIPEAVDSNIFKPNKRHSRTKVFGDTRFKFLVMGRWDYRKSITEIIQTFCREFKPKEPVDLIINVDNPFPVDGLTSTGERLVSNEINHPNVKIVHFLPFEQYVKYLQNGHCLVSCSRSEGWNLPLIEAIACGIPTICSDYGAQLEFARGISHLVDIKDHRSPQQVFIQPDGIPGTWAEPDFGHLQQTMRKVYENHSEWEIYAKMASRQIREKFTWESAANKALKAIEEFGNEKEPIVDVPIEIESDREPVKLNLGCGNDIKPGYINVDTYNNSDGVDVEANILDLPFKDNTVDEIYISHVMEHLGLYGVPVVMAEFSRVMRDGAKLIIRVPDLDSCIKVWQESNTADKVTKLDYVFGGQSHEGDFHKNGFTQDTLRYTLERYGFDTIRSEPRPGVFGDAFEIYNESIKTRIPTSNSTKINCHFVDGPFLEVLGDDSRQYEMMFKDGDAVVHRRLLTINMWTRPHRQWFTEWTAQLFVGNDLIFEHLFDAKGKRILISFDSKSLGDTIAWVPYLDEFRAKNRCHVIASTFWNGLFKDEYPQIEFVPPGSTIPDLYASYKIGCWDDDLMKNKFDWQETALQKIACDILGLEYKEIKPRIKKPNIKPTSKIVTISEGATAGCKQWQHPDAWQTIVDYLKHRMGYEVVVISKEETTLKDVVDRTNKPIEETIANIAASELFIGVSSGPAWLAWALDIPVVMISGCTHKWNEFQSGNIRMINEDVCHGCFNNKNHEFDRGDWHWCPKHKDSPQHYECTKHITPKAVIEEIKKALK